MNDKEKLEQEIAHFNGRRYAVICPHPDYLALFSTMSEKNVRRLKPGRQVITSVIGTSLPYILQLGLIPVFVDCEIPGYNPNPCLVEEAVSKDTGAILLQHTLGNPVALKYISDTVLEGNWFWSVFSCGAALGGTCTGTFAGQTIGAFGDFSTFDFKRCSGIVLDSTHLEIILRTYCSGKVVMDKEFIAKLTRAANANRENWKFFRDTFKAEKLDEYFVLPSPHYMANPNWQGFCLTCREIDREKLLKYLTKRGVITHLLPVQNYGGYKMVGTTKNVNIVRDKTFWIDVSESYTDTREYVVDCFKKGLKC